MGAAPRAARVEVMRNASLRYAVDAAGLPRITLVTACRNHAEFLEAAMLSVLEQGYPNLEYIVMDGGSTDESPRIIARYERYLSRWESAADGGPYHALQRAFSDSSGEIMGWLNADDMLMRNALWTVAGIFAQLPQVEWITGVPLLFDPHGRTYVPHCRNRWSRTRFLRGDYQFIQQESTLWRRGLWKRAGARLDTRLRLAADMELWMRFFRHAPLHTADVLIGGFRKRDESRSRRHMQEYMEEAADILAREPRSERDQRALARFAPFDRWWRRWPVVRKSWRVRQAYEKLFEFPPRVVYNDAAQRFELCEGRA